MNEKTVGHIERVDADVHSDSIESWLVNRCSGTDLRVIFEPDAVFDAPVKFLLANWRDIFCPSRDDALIVSLDQDWVMFYCHEDEFEFGRIDATLHE